MDVTSRNVNRVTGAYAFAVIPRYRHVHRSPSHSHYAVGLQCSGCVAHIQAQCPTIYSDGSIVVGVDAITAHIGDVHRATIHKEVVVAIPRVAFAAMYAITDSAEDVYASSRTFQFHVFLGADGMFQPSRHIQSPRQFEFGMPLEIQCRLLRPHWRVCQGANSAFNQFHGDPLATLHINSRTTMSVGELHAIQT